MGAGGGGVQFGCPKLARANTFPALHLTDFSDTGHIHLMKILRPRALFGCLAVLLFARPLAAQVACDTTRSPWVFLRQCFGSALPQGDTVALARGLQEAVTSLRSPYSLNPALAEFAEVTRTRRLIGALKLNFVMVQQGYNQNLALSYDWKRDLARTKHNQGSPHGGFHSGLEARGLLAPAADSNPEDFNEAVAHASFFYARGGAANPAVMRAHVAGFADSAAAYKPQDAYLNSPEYLSYMATLWDSLSTQFYFTAGPETRYETNQGADKAQLAYGVRIGMDLKAWKPHSRLARANIFDWPTALIRLATGTDASWKPSGAAIPTVSVLVHNVIPGANAVRDSVFNLDPFSRIALEMRYRTKLTSVAQGPVWLAVEYRQHLELNADQTVVDAGLHRHSRVHLQVETPGGLTLSWAKGNLPLTETGSDRFGLGFQFKYR